MRSRTEAPLLVYASLEQDGADPGRIVMRLLASR